MPTPRYGAACVNTEDGLVVAGGYADGDQSINSVEALCTDRSTKWWRTVYSLPKRQSYLSGVVCGNILYLAGGLEDGKPSQTPFTCNLSDINVLPTRHISHASGDKHGWFEFSQLPVTQATLASFNDRLLAIGGNDDSGNPTKNVYVYDGHTDSWKVVMKMRNKRSSCLTATLPGDRLIIVGGCSSQSQEDRVEIL